MGEIIAETLIYFILNYLGGTLRWLLGTLWSSIFNTPKHTYKEYVHGPEEFDHYDSAHGCINIAIGIGFIAIVVYIISKI